MELQSFIVMIEQNIRGIQARWIPNSYEHSVSPKIVIIFGEEMFWHYGQKERNYYSQENAVSFCG